MLLLEDAYGALDCFQQISSGEKLQQAQLKQLSCMLRLEQVEDAIGLADRLIKESHPVPAAVLSLKAAALIFSGDKARSRETNELALQADRSYMPAWQNHVEVAVDNFTNSDLADLESLTKSEGRQAMTACFVLADVYEHRQNLKCQMNYLERGNSLAAKTFPYDRAAFDAFETMMRSWYRRVSDTPSPCRRIDNFSPVFILGLPRSGTTLLEQILSRHCAVQASGESLAMLQAVSGQALETLIQQPEANWLPEFREKYMSYQNSRGFVSGMVIDKNIFSFRIAGLLHRAFPEARFIATHRHPLDLCIGGWKKQFSSGLEWVYSPEGLAHALKQFRSLCSFWAEQDELPLLQISYEDLVTDPQSSVERLCNFLGIEFESGLLSPELQDRVVTTASTMQIRERLNTSSVFRWKRYGSLIDPFREALEAEAIAVPE